MEPGPRVVLRCNFHPGGKLFLAANQLYLGLVIVTGAAPAMSGKKSHSILRIR